MSEIADKIRSRGHWEVVVRPEEFVPERVSYADLEDVLDDAVVRFRGWPVPCVDARHQPMRGEDWIGQEIDAAVVNHFEAWRFFTSGQLVHLRAVSADWRAGREATPVPAGYDRVIEVWEILFYLTEVFELAARLALGSAGDDPMVIEVSLRGLRNRALVVGQRNRGPFIQPYSTDTPEITRARTLPRDELVAEARSIAVDVAREIFARFGWKVSADKLAEHQLDLTERT